MRRLLQWINNLFNREKSTEKIIEEITFDIDKPKDRQSYIQSLCEQIKTARDDVDRIKPEYQEISSLLSDYQKIEELPNEHKHKIKILALQVKSFREERENYQTSLDIDPKYRHLELYEDSMNSLLQKIKSSEDRQALIKRDLEHLEGEKADLNYEKNKLNAMQSVVKVMSIVFLSLFSIFLIILATMFVYEKDILIPGIILVLFSSFFVLFIYMSKRKTSFSLINNDKKQKRAIELMNKVKIKYVNTTNYLEFEYKKLKINSSDELRYNWEQYVKQKEERRIYKNATNQLVIHEEELIELLKSFKMEKAQQLQHMLETLIDEAYRHIKIEELLEARQKFKEQIHSNHDLINGAHKQLQLLAGHNPMVEREVENILQENNLSLKELDK
jgi:hypothetical protein